MNIVKDCESPNTHISVGLHTFLVIYLGSIIPAYVVKGSGSYAVVICML